MIASTSSRRSFSPAAALLIVCLGATCGPLDSSVNTAFPAITQAFGLPTRDIQWVVVSYVIAQSGLMIVFGRIGDLFGHRRVFALGLAGCVVTHAAAAAASTFGMLIVARVFQGAAVGMTLACAPALATLMFPPADKRRVVSYYVMATSLGMAIGPLLGGLLVAAFGWPGVYAFRVPLAALVLVLLPWLPQLPSLEVRSSSIEAAARRAFDWPGAGLMLSALTGIILSLGEAARPSGSGWLALLLLVLGGLSAAAFVRRESRIADPIMRIEPFASPQFAALQLASSVAQFSTFSILLLVPYVLAARGTLSIVEIGALLALFPAGAVLGGLLTGRAIAEPMVIVRAGLWLVVIGLAAVATTVGHAASWPLALALLLTGCGLGGFQVGYTDATTTLLPEHERGVAGSLVSVTRLVGVVLGASGISWLNERTASFTLTFAVLAGVLAVFSLGVGRYFGGREV